ncbi:MAG: hypothetical protein QOG62_2734 [Thermoleophilaceae bacterium]|nr:hypothetical protein [Thermoleophilaceae bacterium]
MAEPGLDDKTLGTLVTEVTEKTTLLIHEEIELAKAEVTSKLTKLGIGAGVAGAAGIFLVFSLIYGLISIALAINSTFGTSDWFGFAVVWLGLVILAAIAGLVAYRLFKKASPPVPTMAMDEAKATREAIEEVRR